MVNLITAKITNQQVVSQNLTYNKEASVEKEKDKLANPVAQKSSNAAKSILPLGLIAGGGILIYYGLRKPDSVKFLKKMVKDRFFEIEKNVQEFSTYLKGQVNSSFGDTIAHIEEYKKAKLVNAGQYLEPIVESKDAKSALNAQDSAFVSLSEVFNEFRRAGASDFDTFKVKLSARVREVSYKIDEERQKKTLACSDLIPVPPFRDGKHSDLVETSENELANAVSSVASQMLNLQNEKLHGVLNSQTRKMADVIAQSRSSVVEAKKLLIDSTFAKFRQILNLPEDFVPSYSKTFTLDNFSKLSPEELKPQKYPLDMHKIFSESVYWKAVETKDFNNLSKEDVKETFYMASPYTSLKEIGITIDRLRLRNELDKSLGKNNESLYNTAIAKLECLSVKLRELGEEELIQRCNKDFDNLNTEQRKARLYYVNDVSRRLGFPSVWDMDEYLVKNNYDYSKMSIRKYMEIFKENPDIYFV